MKKLIWSVLLGVVVSAPAMAAEQLTPRQMDAVTAGFLDNVVQAAVLNQIAVQPRICVLTNDCRGNQRITQRARIRLLSRIRN